MATFRWSGHPNDKLFSKDMAEYMAMCVALTTNCTATITPWPENHPDAEDFKGVYLVCVYDDDDDDDNEGTQLSNTSAVREWIRTRIWYEQQQLDNSKGSQS